jgi:hypothetical protein
MPYHAPILASIFSVSEAPSHPQPIKRIVGDTFKDTTFLPHL